MGPSGSGKTSVLNALAGQVRASKHASLHGTLRVNGERVGKASEAAGVRLAYLQQEDIFYAQMTVRETLLFAARLRLPKDVPLAEKEALVEKLIRKLSLVKAADTIVGSSSKRGISGGERKRLAIGCELLGDPNLLFLDEPTSGLGAYQEQQVVTALKTLADEGTTVVCVIHQPRGSIFNMFDDLMLLADGKLMYSGPAAKAASHFWWLGHRKPSGINAGEYVVDLVSTDFESQETIAASRARIDALAAKAAVAPPSAAVAAGGGGAGGAAAGRRRRPGAGVVTQFRLLLRRAWREVARSKAAITIKAVQQVMIAVIYGGIYSLSDSQASIQDRFGLLSLVAIGAGQLAIASTIRSFPKEKTIVERERSKGIYDVGPYFLSKVVAEAPLTTALSALGGVLLYPLVGLQGGMLSQKFANFLAILSLEGLASGGLGLLLGAAAPSSDAALAMFPPIIVLMIIFNGFNIAEENTPALLQFIPQVSFIRWCSEGLAVNEFSGLTFSCEGARGPCAATGEDALARVSMASTVKGAMLAQSRLVAGSYAASYAILQRNRPRFLSVLPPAIK